MNDFPHHYRVIASEGESATVVLESERLAPLRSAAPAQFGGPGDRWSPETLLVGAVADCFVLTFRAIAAASRLPWTALTCDVDGTLDRVDRVAQFTRFDITATLVLPPGVDQTAAHRVLEKAERGCLITNSLKAAVQLHAEIATGELAGAGRFATA
jgi:organic hydroperoxide reductase OsmC/OhrA